MRAPIFIVGTGRCGSTLLGRILRSHPSVVGFPNEANHLWHPTLYPHEFARQEAAHIEMDPRRFTEASLRSWSPNHPQKIRHVFSGFHFVNGARKAFVVKSAMISFLIPKITEIFPEARFIHLYRSGPFVVSSYSRKNFGKLGLSPATEDEYLLHCARYYNECILEIERCKTSLALLQTERFLDLSYEALCNDPATELTRIAAFMEIDADRFSFDLSVIQSMNERVATSAEESGWRVLLAEMHPAMSLKGYLLPASRTVDPIDAEKDA